MPFVTKTSTRAPWLPAPVPFERAPGTDGNQNFYNGKTWRRLRAAVLGASPLCVACESEGLVVPATVVDHIRPINEGGAKLDPANLQTLCETCHNSKSASEGHEKHGKKRVERGDKH